MMRAMVMHEPPRSDLPRGDQIVVLTGASWADYQRVMEMRGDRAVPRVAFLEGLLEIMSPSPEHESIKSVLGCLVEAYCLERDIEFRTVGSWTIENKALGRGVEPDECWVFGPAREASKPDLAIEVVWSSGGIDKLEIYRKLGVREVWYWKKRRITPYVLVGDSYEERAVSEVLSGIDLASVASFLDAPTTSAAIRAYRETLR
jgi:Uma2 family endonuclease